MAQGVGARPSSPPAIGVTLDSDEIANARGIVNPYPVSSVFDANTFRSVYTRFRDE